MAEEQTLRNTLGNMMTYFLGCMENAAKGSEAEKRFSTWVDALIDARDVIWEQERRDRLRVHNIGNVTRPDGVTEEQFRAVMANVTDALERTDRGEPWPYDGPPKEEI